LGALAALVVAWFSRQREYRADAGAAQLMGRKQPMINALARLGGLAPGELPQSIQAMGISGMDVSSLLAEGRHRDIAEYCLRDVVATVELHKVWEERLKGIK
jgi:heat shock protein HtpX